MKEEALALVDELNSEAITGLEHYFPFDFRSYGWNHSAIYFMGVILWTDKYDEREYIEDTDEREYIEDTDEQEPLRDYILRESKVILNDLNKKLETFNTKERWKESFNN